MLASAGSAIQMYVYVCKVFCLEAGPSLDMHYQGSTYLSLLDKRKEWGSMSSPYLTVPVALLATQINWYATWRSKMKLLRVGYKQIFSIIVNGTNIVRIEFLKFSRNILDNLQYLRNNEQIQSIIFNFQLPFLT